MYISKPIHSPAGPPSIPATNNPATNNQATNQATIDAKRIQDENDILREELMLSKEKLNLLEEAIAMKDGLDKNRFDSLSRGIHKNMDATRMRQSQRQMGGVYLHNEKQELIPKLYKTLSKVGGYSTSTQSHLKQQLLKTEKKIQSLRNLEKQSHRRTYRGGYNETSTQEPIIYHMKHDVKTKKKPHKRQNNSRKRRKTSRKQR